MTMFADRLNLEPRRLAARWAWFVALGVVMVIAGGLALGDTASATLLSTIFIGAIVLAAGIFQIVHAFANKEWGAFLIALLCGALYVAGGFLIMDEPITGSVVITVMLTVALAVNSVMRIVMALRHREIKGWWLMLLSGVVGIAVAVLLYLSLPWSSFWFLGTLIAIELIFHGVGWIRLGMALRTEHRAQL
jgi:uncharacterized membrane protein HdeD (DUF308 family)